jgi:hypothetical protein
LEITNSMKQKTLSALSMGFALLGMASIASAGNDRLYTSTISPNDVAPGTTTNFNLTLTNNILSGPSHFLRQVIVTVPAGFTITGPVTVQAPPAAPLPWKVTYVKNSNTTYTITVVSGSPSDASVTAGQAITITVPAMAPALVSCSSPTSYGWGISASQVVGGGTGNAYLLTPGTTNPSVKVSCDTLTSLNLAISPGSIGTTGNPLLTLTAILTKTLTGDAVVGEPVTFTLGGAAVTCMNPAMATTDSAGTAICSYYPLPNPLLVTGTYDSQANFAGDAAIGLGSSTSNVVTLDVNATDTGLNVPNVIGSYGGMVSLTATLTANTLPVPGETVTFYLAGIQVGSGMTNSSGVATVGGVSLVGIPPGTYGQEISATFAGDATYSAVSSSATLTVGQIVTASVTASDKVYDGTTVATITTCSLTGLVGGDASTVKCAATGATFSSPNVGGPYTVTATGITLSGTNAGNYTLASTTATTTASITKASSSVMVTGGSFVYDTYIHAATGLASTTAGTLSMPATVVITYGGNCAGAPTTVAQGTGCTATGTYAGDANHFGSFNTAGVTITLASSFVTVTGGSFPYDGTAHVATGLAGTTAGTLTNPGAVLITYSGSCTVAPTTVAEGTTCTATGRAARQLWVRHWAWMEPSWWLAGATETGSSRARRSTVSPR